MRLKKRAVVPKNRIGYVQIVTKMGESRSSIHKRKPKFFGMYLSVPRANLNFTLFHIKVAPLLLNMPLNQVIHVSVPIRSDNE